MQTEEEYKLATGGGGAPHLSQANLDDVVTTAELSRRPNRSPDHAAENRALLTLADALANAPRTILQKLVAAAVELTGAGSAGISVYEPGQAGSAGVFRWRAVAGAFLSFDGNTMPRNFSPCGVVLDRSATQLMADPVRFWPYIDTLRTPVAELLLVPFYDREVPIGTVWIAAHPGDRRFDAEDSRLITSLSRFASAAVQILANLEALEAADKAKDRFLAVLSHELRTPLTPALITASAMQEDESLPAAIRDDAGLIRRNIEVETRLIDDLLDVSRVTSGKLELQTAVLDLHDVLRESADVCRAVARAKGVSVDLDLNAARHVVSGDPVRLRQVFSNLLSNALKFTSEGGRITISTRDDGPGQIRVLVRDTGIGIESDVLPRIFEAFEQGGRATTRKYEGLGLGLAISKGIVDGHRGRITAESAGAGKGTTISVVFPTVVDEKPIARPPMGDSRSGPALSILLVEDHQDSLRAMTYLLRKLQYRVETATTVQGALNVAEQYDFDLLISDVGLPDGSGLDLMRQLRTTRKINGIALTGYGCAADIAQTAEAGFTLHLTKPIGFDQLKNAVQEVAVGRGARQG